jgi:uncharacterized protein YjbI with pentapeptide repeats
MKTIKPLRMGVLTRTFEDGPKSYLVVTLLSLYPFDEPQRALPEVAIWKLAATLSEDASVAGSGGVPSAPAILDEAMPKSCGELLVAGSAYPKERPAPKTYVRVAVSRGEERIVDKHLFVFGDRRWRLGFQSDPEPFESMPITWSRALGGPGFDRNPIGRGIGTTAIDGEELRLLPNIEQRDDVVAAPSDRPDPAGFLPFDLTWSQRQRYIGTYDQAWLDQRYPSHPLDFDWTFFNVAPPDQRIDGFFHGDETFVVENMHAEHAVQTGKLPNLVGRAFVNLRTEEGEALREVPTKIDTVWLFPNVSRVLVVHRGVIEVQEDDGDDALQLVAALERKGEPRSIPHYAKVLASRLDRNDAAAMLRDSDLLPEFPRGPIDGDDDKLGDMTDLVKMEGLVAFNARRGLEKNLEAMRATLRENGLDPSVVPDLPPPPTAPKLDLDAAPAAIAEGIADANRMKSEREALIAKLEQEARALCEAHGVDYEATRKKRASAQPKPTRRLSAKNQLEALEDALRVAERGGADLPAVRKSLSDPKLVARLLDAEERMNEAYRRFGHHYPELDPTGDVSARAELEEGAREGATFAGRDLTGADLSGLDLANIDLEGAFLEGANLRGANLRGARLKNAVLVRADLREAAFAGASLVGANLGGANVGGVDLSGIDLSDAVLSKATFSGGKLVGAVLSRCDLSGALLEDVDASGAQLDRIIALEATLRRVKLNGARGTKALFVKGSLEDVSFDGATLEKAAFVGVSATRVTFRGARIDGLRVLDTSCWDGAVFAGASMVRANLRGTSLVGADFSSALMTGADLSACKLEGAKLCGIDARDAMFVRADLRNADLSRAILISAILQRARLDGAIMKEANLFRADLAKVRGDTATSLQGAFVKRVRFVPDRRPS